MGDRHMHDPRHPRVAGRAEQDPGVGHRRLVVDRASRKAHPVRVVQRPGAAERGGQPGRIGEVERADLDRRATGGAPRVPGDRPHRAARGQEMPGDRRPRVAERAGDDVETTRHGPLPARLTGCRARHADPLS
jgi:hypothetical protein